MRIGFDRQIYSSNFLYELICWCIDICLFMKHYAFCVHSQLGLLPELYALLFTVPYKCIYLFVH